LIELNGDKNHGNKPLLPAFVITQIFHSGLLLRQILFAYFLLFAHGLAPFFHAAPLIVGLNDEAGFLCSSYIVPCQYMGGEAELPAVQSQSTISAAAILRVFGIGFPDATLIVLWIAIVIGIRGFDLLIRHYTKLSHSNIALAAAGLFYLSPFIDVQAGMGGLLVGFCLLPAMVAHGVTLKRRANSFFAAHVMYLRLSFLFSLSLFVVFADPYPYVIGLCIATLLILLNKEVYSSPRKFLLGFKASFFMLVPGVLYFFHTRGVSTGTSSIEFYRGQGADLAGIVLPSNTDQIFGKILPKSFILNRSDFSGDGLQIPGSYIGMPILIFYTIILLFVFFYGRNSISLASLKLISFGAFIIGLVGLGPSLKFFSKSKQTENSGTIQYSDYLVDSKDVVFDFPWEFLWSIQPLASMRTTFRWEIGANFLLCLAIGVGVTHLLNENQIRSKILIFSLVGIICLSMPSNPLKTFQYGEAAREMSKIASQDLNLSKQGLAIPPESKVLFLPAGNDYLIDFISAVNEMNTYNSSFDKYLPRVRSGWPNEISSIVESHPDKLTKSQVCNSFGKKQLDFLIFPLFDLRWDSYSWPPSESNIKERFETTIRLLDKLNLNKDPIILEKFIIIDKSLCSMS
jgi:hypothetical protein